MAAEEGRSMKELVVEAILQYLSSSVLDLLLTAVALVPLLESSNLS